MKRKGKIITAIAVAAVAALGAVMWANWGKATLVYELNEDGNSYRVVDFVKKNYFGIQKAKNYNVTIPETYKGLPVTEITGGAFYQKLIDSIKIPSSMKRIYPGAFCCQYLLKTVEIAEGAMITIGSGAFSECRNLTTVKIPNSVQYVESGIVNKSSNVVFNEKDGIQYLGNDENPYVVAVNYVGTNNAVVLDEQCRAVAGRFSSTALTGISLNEGLVSVGNSAFATECNEIMNVQLPESLKYIGDTAVWGLSLMGVEIPAAVESIGNHAFGKNIAIISYKGTMQQWCEGVERSSDLFGENATVGARMLMIENLSGDTGALTIPEGVKTIGRYAFYGCDNIVTADIPESVETIGWHAFEDTAIIGFTGAEGVKTVENKAFYSCKNLVAIAFGDSLERVGENAFAGCAKLATVVLPEKTLELDYSAIPLHGAFLENNPYVDGVLWIGKHVIRVDTTVSGAYTLPEDTLSIMGGAFSGTKITSFVVPKNVTYIGESTFQGCKQLESITLPEGMKVLKEFTFYGCESLTELVLPSTVTKIEERAIEGCKSLKKLTLPKGLLQIENNSKFNSEDMKITDIYYAGKKKDWNKIVNNWEYLLRKIRSGQVVVHYGA